MLLARVCRTAADREHGWKVKVMSGSREIAIVFSDGSAAIIDASAVEVRMAGKEVATFKADYDGARGPLTDEVYPVPNFEPDF